MSTDCESSAVGEKGVVSGLRGSPVELVSDLCKAGVRVASAVHSFL